MELKKCINTTKEKIESNKHNIFVPICLGNKFFLKNNKITDNVKEYINWSLEKTKDKVLIFIVDKIQDTNYYVRNKNSSEAANLRRVLREGNEIRKKIEKLTKKYSKEEQSKIEIVQFEEYEQQDRFCSNITRIVYREFKNNKKFREAVLNAVRKSVTDREFSEEEYFRFADYVLDEFSAAYSGITYNDIHYDIYIYPDTDAVVDLIEGIQKSKSFTKLHKKLPKEITALGILN